MSSGALAGLWFFICLAAMILGASIGGEHARKKAKEEKPLRFRLAPVQAKEGKVKEEIHKKT